MARKFATADLHLGHRGVCTFLAPNGVDKLRPWDTPEEMDEALIENWNAEVDPDDEVYVLGDVCLKKSALATVGRLNGRKHLIAGNHDTFDTEEYLEYFYRVSPCRVLRDMILTHIPVHTSQLQRFKFNLHGHLHAFSVLGPDGQPDPRYKCVSLEQTNFKPVLLDKIRNELEARKKIFPELFPAK